LSERRNAQHRLEYLSVTDIDYWRYDLSRKAGASELIGGLASSSTNSVLRLAAEEAGMT
jgi:hypothetical protein